MNEVDVKEVWIVIQFFHLNTLEFDETNYTKSNNEKANKIGC